MNTFVAMSPKKPIRTSKKLVLQDVIHTDRIEEEPIQLENLFPDQTTQFVSQIPVDNMAIIRNASTGFTQSFTTKDTSTPTEHGAFRTFCDETGIPNTIESYQGWRNMKTAAPVSVAQPPPPVVHQESAQQTAGRSRLQRNVDCGYIRTSYLSARIPSGFNKQIFSETLVHDLSVCFRSSAGMGIITPESAWCLITGQGITETICDQLMRAQYLPKILLRSEPERHFLSLLRAFDVFMLPGAVLVLVEIMERIRGFVNKLGFGPVVRLQCFLYVVLRCLQDSLHAVDGEQFIDILRSEVLQGELSEDFLHSIKSSRKEAAAEEPAAVLRGVNSRLDDLFRKRPLRDTAPPDAPSVKPDLLAAKRTPVCLEFLHHSSLCPAAATSQKCAKLHHWPSTMPAKTLKYLKSEMIKIPLPAGVASASGATIASARPNRASRQGSASSTTSLVSSLSSVEDAE